MLSPCMILVINTNLLSSREEKAQKFQREREERELNQEQAKRRKQEAAEAARLQQEQSKRWVYSWTPLHQLEKITIQTYKIHAHSWCYLSSTNKILLVRQHFSQQYCIYHQNGCLLYWPNTLPRWKWTYWYMQGVAPFTTSIIASNWYLSGGCIIHIYKAVSSSWKASLKFFFSYTWVLPNSREYILQWLCVPVTSACIYRNFHKLYTTIRHGDIDRHSSVSLLGSYQMSYK